MQELLPSASDGYVQLGEKEGERGEKNTFFHAARVMSFLPLLILAKSCHILDQHRRREGDEVWRGLLPPPSPLLSHRQRQSYKDALSKGGGGEKALKKAAATTMTESTRRGRIEGRRRASYQPTIPKRLPWRRFSSSSSSSPSASHQPK